MQEDSEKIPKPKTQIPNKSQAPKTNKKLRFSLSFWYLKFGIWDFFGDDCRFSSSPRHRPSSFHLHRLSILPIPFP